MMCNLNDIETLARTLYGAVRGRALGAADYWADSNSVMMPVSKGDTYNCTGATTFIFYPCK